MGYVLRWTRALELDRFVWKVVRGALGLAKCTCDTFVPNGQGRLGLWSVEDELGSLLTTHAVKMLTSPDPQITGLARHSLDETMRTRYGDLTTDQWLFLVGGLRLQLASRQGNISTLWSSVRGLMEERKIHVSGGSVPSRDSVGGEDIHSAVKRTS